MPVPVLLQGKLAGLRLSSFSVKQGRSQFRAKVRGCRFRQYQLHFYQEAQEAL